MLQSSRLLILLLLLTGCSGIKPYQPPDHREEGPQQGLFTGEKGAFEIPVSKTAETKP